MLRHSKHIRWVWFAYNLLMHMNVKREMQIVLGKLDDEMIYYYFGFWGSVVVGIGSSNNP